MAGLLGGRGLAGLVNNAGIALGGPLEYFPPETLRRQLEINVIGLHAVTAAFLPLVRRGRGRIVHIGSISGRVGSPFIGPYAASKHAVEALADALRIELRPEGIHVALIEPGRVRTPIWAKGLERSGAGSMECSPPRARCVMGEGSARSAGCSSGLRSEGIAPEGRRQGHRPRALRPAPRIRYVLGRDARVRLALLRLLPSRVMDALVLRFLARMERSAS